MRLFERLARETSFDEFLCRVAAERKIQKKILKENAMLVDLFEDFRLINIEDSCEIRLLNNEEIRGLARVLKGIGATFGTKCEMINGAMWYSIVCDVVCLFFKQEENRDRIFQYLRAQRA